ncbi:tetratricopeptide repeat protein [Amycolatopsis sp. cg13]|uniref:P-loop NTPase n=1 Tax=Amycolatopsis sp. cg13 TaxID=3238807 RepID=UPI0035258953
MTGTAPGSGYVIAPSLVLTSAHVVDAAGERATVFFPGQRGVFTGVVAWRGTPGGSDDAALIEVDGAGWAPPLSGAVDWGRLVTHRPGAQCECGGVPDLVQRPDRAIDVLQLTGFINPGDRAVGERYVINLGSHPPAGRSPWGGMSGAAMICEGLVTGVVAAEPADRVHSALEAVPVFVLLREPAFAEIVARHSGTTSVTCDAVELRGLADPQARSSAGDSLMSPAGLLAPRRAVVPFHGREETLAKLDAWAKSEGPGAWLLHGPGGQGKTRLAHQFGASRVQDGWAVLWLDKDAPMRSLDVLAGVKPPTLVVVDYAEGRSQQLAALADVLARRRSSAPVKLLLIARATGAWWRELPSAGDAIRDVVDIAQVSALPALDGDSESCTQSYLEAVTAFGAAASRISGSDATAWSAAAAAIKERPFRGLKAETVLGVHMTALADLLDAIAESARPTADAQRGPEDRMLDHERGYWRIAALASGLSSFATPAMLDDIVAAATVVAPDGRDELDDLLARIPSVADLPLGQRETVRLWLLALYPIADNGKFEGLGPDRLAERLVGRLLLDRDRPCVLETLAASVSEEEAQAILTVTARAAGHAAFGSRVSAAATALCLRHSKFLLAAVDTATQVEDPTPLIDALTGFSEDLEADSSTLGILVFAFPEHSEVLADAAVAITAASVRRCREQSPKSSADDAYQAVMLQHHALRLNKIGRYDDSLSAITESVKIMRQLQKTRPDAPPTLLFPALNTLSSSLKGFGRFDEALDCIDESVRLQRGSLEGSAMTVSDARWYATSLADLGNILELVGKPEEAIDAINEATDIRRALAAYENSEDLADLASSLNSQSNILANLEQHSEALTAAQESVGIRRRLAESHPDAHSATLDMSLYGLASRLGDLGQHEQALEAITEAVEIERRLAERRPAVYAVRLAESLRLMSTFHHSLGRLAHGLACAAEAIDIQRRLAADGHWTRLSELADSLSSFASISRGLGQIDDELSARLEEIEVEQRLVEHDPVHLRSLVPALVGLSECRKERGQTEEALEAITGAVEGCRRLDFLETRARLELLADLLCDQANLLHDLGRYDAEASALSEAASIVRCAKRDGSPAHSEDLASRLLVLSDALSSAGRIEEAEVSASEAADVLRKLDEHQPGACTRDLATSLGIQALHLESLDRRQDSLDAIVEAVEALRRDRRTGTVDNLLYTGFLHLLAVRLAEFGRKDEAIAAINDAIDVEQETLREMCPENTDNITEYQRLLKKLRSAKP